MNHSHNRLFGDGIHDDAPAIQAILDSGASTVVLPPPQKHYLIGKTLKIHSGQELRLDRNTLIRRAPGSDCVMLTNADPVGGDRDISISGGIWDYSNLEQYPNPAQLAHVKELPARPMPKGYSGIVLEFRNVAGFRMNGLAIRNPGLFATAFHKVTEFVIDDIEFDFRTCNPVWANMDGIHLNGSCIRGSITNLRGSCYDDMVALNAPEGDYPGPVTDIVIDGIYCGYCHSAVRLLSYGEPVERITIRNIHGTFYRYMVGITHFLNDVPGPGIFNDIVIENCFCGKARQPEMPWKLFPMAPILIESFCKIGDLRISGVHREESVENVPFIAYNVDSDRPVMVDSHIRNLTIENCGMTNHQPEPLVFFQCDGPIDNLKMNGNHLFSAPGAAPCVELAGKQVPIQKKIGGGDL